jgi:hypothetical protein
VYSDGGFDFNTFSNRNSQPRFVWPDCIQVPGALEFRDTNTNITVSQYSVKLTTQMYNLTSPIILGPGRHWMSFYPVSTTNVSQYLDVARICWLLTAFICHKEILPTMGW